MGQATVSTACLISSPLCRTRMASAELKVLRLPDAELHYSEKGEGQPVVLVHGTFGDYRLWEGLSRELSRNYKTITYSRRGAYPNAPPAERWSSIALHSSDLSALVSEIQAECIHLVGESYGASVALHFALNNPTKTRSLSIDEPPVLSLLSGNEADLRQLSFFENEALRPALEYFTEDKPVDAARVIIDTLEGAPGLYDSLPETIKSVIGANSPSTFEDLKGGFAGISEADLGQMKTPTLLMKSDHGPNPLKLVVDRLHERIPGSVLKEIKGTSHGTIIESNAYLSAVLDFIARN